MAQTPEGAAIIAARNAGISLAEYQANVAAGLKRCTTCKTWKVLADYNADRSRGDGKMTKCHGCVRVKVRMSTKGRASTFKGQTHTAAAKAAMSQAKKGRPSVLKGRSLPIELRQKISQAVRAVAKRGPECPAYIDGRLAERKDDRFSPEMKRWRYDVFSRDKFTCRRCGDSTGGNLRAHHIKRFATHPELRFDVSNGITLCDPCHKLEHTND